MKKLYSSEFFSLILQFFKRICSSDNSRFNRFLILCCLACFTASASAQSLAAGDLAVVRINEDGTGADGFSLVTLVALPLGTSINITDSGWGGDALGFISTETTVVFTTTAAYPVGTVFHFDEDTDNQLAVRINGAATAAYNLTATNFNLSAGDQVLVYQGTAANPTFITGLHNDDGGALSMYGFGNDAITHWSEGSAAADANMNGVSTSRVPKGLTNGVNCISLFYSVTTNAEKGNSIYKTTALTEGTKAELMAAINNKANWLTDNTDNTRYPRQNYSFSVTGANTAPVLTSGGNVAYTEGDAAILLFNNLATVADADGDAIIEATVTIGGAQLGDVLNAVSPAPFTASYDASTKKLTLSGSGTAAQMQAALNSITYHSTSENPTVNGTANTRIISTTVEDSKNAVSNTNTIGIFVYGVNDAPVNTTPAAQTTAEDVAKVFNAANGNQIRDRKSVV